MTDNTYKIPGVGGKLRFEPQQKAENAEPSEAVKISFLGGLNEVGKNMTVFEYGDSMIILDCGLAFPDEDLRGIDLVLPDFTYVLDNAEKVKGIFITHGHEDHIGGLAFLLQQIDIPVYATKLTVGLIECKLEEYDLLTSASLHVIEPDDNIAAGEFTVEAIHVNHSIPDAIAVAIRCDAGTIVHTGDFKIDTTPIDGEPIDLTRFAEIGKENVLCLMQDSTNAERAGYTQSEHRVGDSLRGYFDNAGSKRVIVATFASNVHRIQQIITISERVGRKVVLSGRSIENVVRLGESLGYMTIKPGTIIDIDSIDEFTDDQLTIITTGSQGETMSALTRMATGVHRKIKIGPNDLIIISATPIPGNEKTVGFVINELMKLGAEVLYSKMYDVHVSGHACAEELKIIMSLVRPKYFIPVHGERRHLEAHRLIAKSVGIPDENIFIASNGTSYEISEDGAYEAESVQAGRVMVDGNGVGDIGNVVLRDRIKLGNDGVFIISFVLDAATYELESEIIIESKGFTYVDNLDDPGDIFVEAKDLVAQIIYRQNFSGTANLRNKIRDEVGKLINCRIKRSPVIMPIINEL